MPKFFVTPQDIVGKKSPYVTGKERTISAASFLWNVGW